MMAQFNSQPPDPGNSGPEAWTAELNEEDREFALRELAKSSAENPVEGS